MNPYFKNIVLESTGAKSLTPIEVIQTLWSGYGEIVRVALTGTETESAVLKYIVLPEKAVHPRGWNTNNSHERKIKSYDVEMHWYRNWSKRCHSSCRVAQCYAATSKNHEHIIVLEDLDAAGFTARKTRLNKEETKVCLKWLANFHATFLGETPDGLWKTGTYWHLETRPDELSAMKNGSLKKSAKMIDELLNKCRYKTLVHGDAKVANFCFSADGKNVAAVDFQYTGGGCGMKDVVYFLGSCLNENQCKQWESELLEYYFKVLKAALYTTQKEVNWHELKSEWLALFPVAWTDFYRFLCGWMPTHSKINTYTQQMAEKSLHQISRNNNT
ncbi:MAG: ecdysteroid 22-kinase family protein [Gammaproteobacteria bacterium]|nr:ecdysteroid 22-kinase family protein [Gammaproteobacteria bacterium]